LLIGILERAGVDIGHSKDKQGSFDCIFPKQDSLDGLSLGNLIALPWSGIAFKDRSSTLFVNPNTFEAYGQSLEENIELFLDDFEAITKEDVDSLLGEMDIIIDKTNNSNHPANQPPLENMTSINPAQVLLGVPEGERDEKIFRYACSLRARGLSKEETKVLAKIAADNCSPPFPYDQVEIKVESAWKYSETNKVIDEINEKHACVMNGGSFVVLNEIPDPVFRKKNITLSTATDFKNRYMNKKIRNPNKAIYGAKKYVSVAEVWLHAENRRFYEGIVFEPNKKKSGGDDYYNLFNGFTVEPVQGDWSKFRGHIENVICNGYDDLYQYLICWMARNVQFPGGSRPGVAIVLRGEQGSGKGCFANNYGKIFGSHFVPVAEYHKVAGRFNGHLKDALLVFVDESFWVGNSSAEAIIKTMITEPVITVEEKFKDAYRLRNHKSLIIASNKDWAVPVAKKERRFCVIEVSDSHVDDFAYFDEIYKEMENGGTEAMLYDLLKVDLSKVNLRKIPQTQALMNQIEQSMDTIEKFWFEKLQSGAWRVQHVEQGVGLGKNQSKSVVPADYSLIQGKHNKDDLYEFQWDDLEFIITEDLHDEYVKYSDKLRENKRVNKSILVKRIKSLCNGIRHTRPTLDNGQRAQGLVLPPLAECRRKFEKMFRKGIKISWL
jgi:hypothetical protein